MSMQPTSMAHRLSEVPSPPSAPDLPGDDSVAGDGTVSVPHVSVIMSVYNGELHLAEAIRSILDQTLTEFEFLILDDGSRDGSPAIIDVFAASDPRIRVIRQENRGLIASLNLLLAESRAPLVARMDADDVSLPTRLERQVAFLGANAEHGVVGTNMYLLDQRGIILECTYRNPLDHADIVAECEYGNPMCHSSVLMRRDVILAAGGYRLPYNYCEDYDLWLRLLDRTLLANLPDRLLLYRKSPGQVSAQHAVDQKIGAAIAWVAHLERVAGRPDPTVDLQELPSTEALDAMFGRSGIGITLRSKVALRLVYSASAMRGRGLELLLRHISDGGDRAGLWRTVLRLLIFGQPRGAIRLAKGLCSSANKLRIGRGVWLRRLSRSDSAACHNARCSRSDSAPPSDDRPIVNSRRTRMKDPPQSVP